VAVFFIHPTSYLSKSNWNAPLDDAEANQNAARYVRNQASVFNATPNIWAPRYRQATFGAFLTDQSDREKALGELVPGSEEYYFFHALHCQNVRDTAKLNNLLNEWRQRTQDENEARRVILNREAILGYEKDPQGTLKYLIERLGLRR
jgi:hypothetical protein